MPTNSRYISAYPKAGDVAVLCEGDLVGYEVSILGRWADERLKNNPMVDVWPCGTSAAIFGISDAIGRSRPVAVIEDRDFRSVEEATSDCAKSTSDRERRDVRILGWHPWKRNEIENYLLQPQVVLETMAEAFGCRPQDVHDGLALIIPKQSVYQAAQYAFYRARRSWSKSDPSLVLPSNVQFRPTWDDDTRLPVSSDRGSIRDSLQLNLDRWRTSFLDGDSTPQGRELLSDFEEKCDEWAAVDIDSNIWQSAWAGKDILQWLRIWMTSRYGWLDLGSGVRVSYKWQGLTRKKFDEQDRPMKTALRPSLVKRFIGHIAQVTEGELFDEWAEIERMLKSANA